MITPSLRKRFNWVLLPLVLIATSAQAEDWPRFLGPNGDNASPEKILTAFPESGPKIEWSLDVNAGYGGSAIVGDEVFFMDRIDDQRDVLHCVGLLDGKERWKWEYACSGRINHPGSRGVPTVTKDTVYASSGFGHVYCIDRSTHKERWVVDVVKTFEADPPRFGYSIHPLIHGDHCLIAPTGDSVGLAALDKKTGKTVWKSESIGGSHSSPVLAKILGQELVVMPGTRDGNMLLSGFDPNNGKSLFHYIEKLTSGRFNPIPNVTMVDESMAFLTEGYGFGTRLLKFAQNDDKIEATLIKSHDVEGRIHPALKVGNQYYVSATGGGGRRSRSKDSAGLVCFDQAGKELWRTGNDLKVSDGSIISVGGILVSQHGGDGTLRLIEPGPSYKELAKAKIFKDDPGDELWAPLAFASGKLVMRSQNQIVCVNLEQATK
ncbi:MAG: outer membrane protein assembly factor BamB [Verrucomicrobiales bacterium]|jgi:outer membrane protein assembly factor BamB